MICALLCVTNVVICALMCICVNSVLTAPPVGHLADLVCETCVVHLQVAAKQLADAHAPGGAAMSTGTATALVAAAGAALGRLAELLRSSAAAAQQKPDVLAPAPTGVD